MNDFYERALHALVELLVSGTVTFGFLWILRPLAIRFGLVDHPQGRKDHAVPTPCIGGVAMLLGVSITMLALHSWIPPNRHFILAAVGLVLIGVLDDLYDIRWWWRVAAQCVAVWILSRGGVQVEHIGDVFGMASTGLGVLSTPFTMFATVGVVNAINMSDGVDGLAGSIVMASLCMFEAAAIYSGNASLSSTMEIFIGAVAGFLLLNARFPWQKRARVFMGNAGSALLGLVIAFACFRLTQNPEHPVSPVLGPWLVATPVIDCLVLMARRTASGRSPFSADHNHMHHLMRDAGFTPSQIDVSIVGVNLALGLAAAIAIKSEVPQIVLVIAFVALCIGYFWLTLKRERGVAFFASLRRFVAFFVRPPAADSATQKSR